MWILTLGISAAALIASIIVYCVVCKRAIFEKRSNKKAIETAAIATFIVAVFVAAIAIIGMIVCGVQLYHADHIKPAKIEYLRTNNAEIEARLRTEVDKFITSEGSIYATYAPNPDSDVAISVPPPLQSSTIVLKLLETYESNNEVIRELELEIISARASRFWLHFGGQDN